VRTSGKMRYIHTDRVLHPLSPSLEISPTPLRSARLPTCRRRQWKLPGTLRGRRPVRRNRRLQRNKLRVRTTQRHLLVPRSPDTRQSRKSRLLTLQPPAVGQDKLRRQLLPARKLVQRRNQDRVRMRNQRQRLRSLQRNQHRQRRLTLRRLQKRSQ